MSRRQGVDYSIYGRALLLLAKNPSIIALPMLAAVLDVLFSYLGGLMTDPLGGLGIGIFSFISQMFYLFAFGGAIIQANNIARGYKSNFDDAWEETRRKAGGLLLAAVGFIFISNLGPYIAQIVPIPYLGLLLEIVAYFFLIFAIPAAAIGGLPGTFAISGSVTTVRNNPVPAVVLAIAFLIVFLGLPQIAIALASGLSPFLYHLALAFASAVGYAYLAFPFATTYDDIAFKRY
jgi:hypothetical protein